MQGREHKHEVIKRFIRNSNPSKKWEHVLLYDEVVCHYLPTELKFSVDGYFAMPAAKVSSNRFTPKIDNENPQLTCSSADCKLCTNSEVRLHFRLLTKICMKHSGPGGSTAS